MGMLIHHHRKHYTEISRETATEKVATTPTVEVKEEVKEAPKKKVTRKAK